MQYFDYLPQELSSQVAANGFNVPPEVMCQIEMKGENHEDVESVCLVC